MRTPAKLFLGAAAAALFSTAAFAADPVYAPMTPAAPMAAPAFDWSGPYVGAVAGIYGLIGTNYMYSGVQFGYNFMFRGNMIAGFEVETTHIMYPLAYVNAALNGRLGVVVGDRVLLYGEAGIGTHLISPIGLFTVAGGIEVAVTNAISVFGEVKKVWAIAGGLVPYGGTFEAGVNFHPGGSMMMASSGGFGGLYFGTFGGYELGPNYGEFGVQFGFNHEMGSRFIVGAEVETYHPAIPVAYVSASLNGRAGVTFGNILAYGEAGIGTFIGVPVLSAGGGVEFALANRGMSVFTEAKALYLLGGGYYLTRVDAGINFAVGR
jgi:outer membrane immunogenic protein